MCFSAEASFGLSAALVPAGAFCLATAHRTQNRPYLPVAIVPLAFGIQQFCEGLVWVGLGQGNDGLVDASAFAYLFFALLLWPVWMPLSVLVLAERNTEKVIIASITLLGLVGSLALYLSLV